MIIQKGNNRYEVSETSRTWKVAKNDGVISVVYEVAKSSCRSFDELKQYVLESDVFPA